MTTYTAKAKDIVKDWVLIDAGDVILAAPRAELGRLRELVAVLHAHRDEADRAVMEDAVTKAREA